MIPRALTIAGSDSGGCAGLQADLKTFAALGVHGMSAVTSVTAQNTQGVRSVHNLPAEEVQKQIESVVEDIGVDAVKTGMLSNSSIIEAVADTLRELAAGPVVVDPVMLATSGDRLLEEEAVETLCRELFPLAAVVTPNRPEAELLSGRRLSTEEDCRRAAQLFLSWGAQSVVIKGGHASQATQALDYFFDGNEWISLSAPRIATDNTHGSGCTFAAAVAAQLARRRPLRAAVDGAKEFVTEAIRNSLNLGRGHGPLGHFHALDSWKDVFGGG